MRRWIVTAALGLAALGLITLAAGRADAHGPRIVVGISSPVVVVASPPPAVFVPAYPVYSYPAPVVVTPAPVVVAAPAPVVVTPAFGAVVRVHPRRVFVRFR